MNNQLATRNLNGSIAHGTKLNPVSRLDPVLEDRIERFRQSGIDAHTATALRVYIASKDETKLMDAPVQAIKDILVEIMNAAGLRLQTMADDKFDDVQREINQLSGFIMTSFGKLTVMDLRTAFQLWFESKLTDSRGNVLEPINHYQNFSMAYIGQWLGAYNRYKLDSITKIAKLLPPPAEPKPTNYDRVKAELEFREEVEKLFREWYHAEDRDRVMLENNHLTAQAYELLQSLGIYTVDKDTKWKMMDAATAQVESSAKKNAIEKLKRLGGLVVETVLVERPEVVVSIAKSLCCDIAFRKCGLDPDGMVNALELDQAYYPNGTFDPSPTVMAWLNKDDDGTDFGGNVLAHVWNMKKARL